MKKKRSKPLFWLMSLVLLLVLAGVGIIFMTAEGGSNEDTTDSYFKAERRDMNISVVESGNVKALKQLEIKCEVEGQTTVLSLVPEGTIITEEDVKNKRLLVELDSSNIRDRITQEEISLQSALASYTQAKESKDIQVNQNESNIKAGELDVKFSRMDLEKYLGSDVANNLIESPSTDFTALLNDPQLQGEALQQLNNYDSDITLSQAELKRATDRLEGTQKLYDKKYVSLDDLQADRLDKDRQNISLGQAQMAKQIFERYEFPKQVEQKLADFSEAQKELERIKARARSELASSEAELKSKEASYRLQKEKYDRLEEQLQASKIYATEPGLVVYATSGNPWHQQPPLEEGSTVRERQVLLTLPDTKQMAAEIKIHEAQIDKVQIGQTAIITLDAFPNVQLEGHVVKKAMLPDPQHRWLNPDLKVYSTDVVIEGEHSMLKPGLSAKVEIVIDKRENVLAVPIQCVVPQGAEQYVYVQQDGKPVPMCVEIGESNDKFIEIKSGIKAGDMVMLNPPRFTKTVKNADEDSEKQDGKTDEQEGNGKDDDSAKVSVQELIKQYQNASPEERVKLMEKAKKLPQAQQEELSKLVRQATEKANAANDAQDAGERTEQQNNAPNEEL